MKTCIAFIMMLVFSLIITSCKKDVSRVSSVSKSDDEIVIAIEKVDSTFSHYFTVLDAFYDPSNYKNGPLSTDERNAIASILEHLSGIRAKGSHTYGGRLWVKQESVEAWKDWYRENKSRLRWDIKNTKVVFLKEK